LLVVVGFPQTRLLYKTLHSDRPFLVAELFKLERFVPFSQADKTIFSPLTGSFYIKNYGKGPGFIREVLVRLTVVKLLPNPHNFAGCEPWTIIGMTVLSR
jgi:hypothetical protein